MSGHAVSVVLPGKKLQISSGVMSWYELFSANNLLLPDHHS